VLSRHVAFVLSLGIVVAAVTVDRAGMEVDLIEVQD